MKKEVTVKAKSVEEALTLAAEQLGAPEAEVKYTVIAEAKRGFLGLGSSDAEISAYYIPRGEQAATFQIWASVYALNPQVAILFEQLLLWAEVAY